MSVSSVETILERIKTAAIYSPITVFLLLDSATSMKFDAVFGATIETQRRINQQDPFLIGSFDCRSDLAEVRATLRRAVAT